MTPGARKVGAESAGQAMMLVLHGVFFVALMAKDAFADSPSVVAAFALMCLWIYVAKCLVRAGGRQ